MLRLVAAFFGAALLILAGAMAVYPRAQQPPDAQVGCYDAQRALSTSRVAQQIMSDSNQALEPLRAAAARADQVAQAAPVALASDAVVEASRAAHARLDQELEKRRRTVEADLDVQLLAAGDAIARRHRLALLIPIRATYAAPGVDLTDELIAAMDGPRAPPDGGRR